MNRNLSKNFIITGLLLLAVTGTSLASHHAMGDTSNVKPSSVQTNEMKQKTVEIKADKLKSRYNSTKSQRVKSMIIRFYKRITGKEFPMQTIVDIAVGNKSFSTLVAAVTAADLVPTLNSNGPFTVFAPTNEAFAKIDPVILASLLTKEKKLDLTSILTYHVVPGNIRAKDLTDGMEVTTVQGAKLKVSIKDGVVKINNSIVTATDIEGRNGFVHVIDTVLLP